MITFDAPPNGVVISVFGTAAGGITLVADDLTENQIEFANFTLGITYNFTLSATDRNGVSSQTFVTVAPGMLILNI